MSGGVHGGDGLDGGGGSGGGLHGAMRADGGLDGDGRACGWASAAECESTSSDAFDDDEGGSAAGAVASGWPRKTSGASADNKCTSGWGGAPSRY